tara:strand:- start:444 stop:1709 length:1266 start_codon:yes stop_codon:yes gene_type:complete
MFIHKEIILVFFFILVFLCFLLIRFFIDFKNFRDSLNREPENLEKKDFFFFLSFKPLVFSVTKILNEKNKVIELKKRSIFFFQNFFRNFPDPLFIIDSNNKIVEINQKAKILLGDENYVDKNLLLVFPVFGLNDLIKKVRSGSNYHSSELELEISDEKNLIFNTWATVIKKEEQQLVFIRLYNITSEKKFQILQNEFVANASHELKTPISAIQGYCETLLGIGKNDPLIRNKFLKTIQKETFRMSSLVSDMMSLFQIQRLEHKIPDTNFDIKFLLEDLEEIFDKKENKKNLKFTIPRTSLKIMGDYEEMRQVMINLIENAIKYGSSEKSIEVKYKRSERYHELQVKDYGQGIHSKDIPFLTNRFYRVSSTRDKNTSSTGLGLAIVKHILKRHNAQLKVESEVGKGSTFSVCMPNSVVYKQQ